MAVNPAPKPPHPGYVSLADLNADEQEFMRIAGRVDPTGQWATPPKGMPAAVEKAPTGPREVPAAPPEVLERIEKARKIESSFSYDRTELNAEKTASVKVKTASADGGAAAEVVAPVVVKHDNPDWVTKPKEDPIDFADRERFLAHILGNIPFTKSYALFGDKLQLTFRTLSCAEQDQIADQIYLDAKHETHRAFTPEGRAEERLMRFTEYLFAGALAEVAVGDLRRILKPFAYEDKRHLGLLPIKQALKEISDDTQSPLMAAMRTTHEKFVRLVNRLTLEAQNPSFWNPDTAG